MSSDLDQIFACLVASRGGKTLTKYRRILLTASACAVLLLGGILAGPNAYAESPDVDALLKMIEGMQRELEASKKQQQKTAEQLEALKSQLKKNTASVEKVALETEQVRKDTTEVQRQIKNGGSVIITGAVNTTKAESDGEQAGANDTQQDSQQAQTVSSAPVLSAPVFKDLNWHISGYADASYRASTGDENRDGKINSFLAATFNPVFHFLYKDLLLFEGELAFAVGADGQTEVELEYGSIDWFVTDYAALAFGKFLSPVGYFRQNLHPTWINKLPLAPAGFGHGGVAPLTDLGVMVRGGFQGRRAFEHDGSQVKPLFNYGFYVGNGPQLELEDGELEALEQEAFGLDDNNNKAMGGRVGIVPIPHLEFGASFMVSNVLGKKEEGVSGPVTDGRYTLWGADFGYTKGPWNIRAEYIKASLDSFWSQREEDEDTELIPATDWSAWYAQVAYRMTERTDHRILKNVELVARYGQFNASGFEHFVEHARPENRLSLGLNYWFSPSAVFKSAVARRDFTFEDNIDSTEYRAQFAYGF